MQLLPTGIPLLQLTPCGFTEEQIHVQLLLSASGAPPVQNSLQPLAQNAPEEELELDEELDEDEPDEDVVPILTQNAFTRAD